MFLSASRSAVSSNSVVRWIVDLIQVETNPQKKLMASFQTDEVLIHLTAQLYKHKCQQNRTCGNAYLRVEMFIHWRTGLLWFKVVLQLRP